VPQTFFDSLCQLHYNVVVFRTINQNPHTRLHLATDLLR